MRRCVLCGRWLLLAFQVEGGVCERGGASRVGGVWANEAARLVWLLGPAGFPEGSGEKKKKKQFSHSVIQSECCSQKYCSPRALLLPVTAECCCWCCCFPPSRGRICPRRAEHSPTVSVASIFAAAAAPEHGSTACK